MNVDITTTLVLRQEYLVYHVYHTIACDNICFNNFRELTGIIPLSFLENSVGIARRGGKIVAGITAQSVYFPLAEQILLKVGLIGEMVLKDVL